MIRRRLAFLITAVLMAVLISTGCTANWPQQVGASESLRLSVIEQALEIARLEGMSGEPE